MANPNFPTNPPPVTDDFFAPIHATLGPGGHVMLFGYRQDRLQIQGKLLLHQRTGSMSAILSKADLSNPPTSLRVVLQDLGEHRDISCGFRLGTTPGTAQYVESDPNDQVKELFVDRLFCSGHTVLGDGSVFATGGLRATRLWDAWDGLFTASLGLGGGLPFVQRWDWAIEAGGWVKLGQLMKGLGDDFDPMSRAAMNCTNWWPSDDESTGGFCDIRPSGITGFLQGIERYYPTATLMLDGQVLIVGGQWYLGIDFQSTTGTLLSGFLPATKLKNLSVELYDPLGGDGGGSTVVLSNSTTPPANAPTNLPSAPLEVFNPDYTHVFVLPTPFVSAGVSYDVLMLGETGKPLGFSTGSKSWFAGVAGWPSRPMGPPNACPNDGASTVLLPLRLSVNQTTGLNDRGYHNGAVLCVGGYDDTNFPTVSAPGSPRKQIDVFDPLAVPAIWSASAQLSVARHSPSAVLLPDGRIVVIGGHGAGQANLLKAEYVVLSGSTTTPLSLAVQLGVSSMTVPRAYHAVTLLLPDGRVFVGGGRIGSSSNSPFEWADYTILSPDYMTAARPTITYVEHKVLHRQNDPLNPATPELSTLVNVKMPAGKTPTEAVLISLGSMTHSFDMNQRYVQVAVTNVSLIDYATNKYALTVTSPEYRWAPPGYYMLFILDQAGIPSPAAMIRLEHP